ncbi:unnamed protein product [marine sediment metagenome]|uniref:Uncharacterized protein n=1 Tax=marine sediment metagenome TaxID=412755 RepID=X1G3H6_9ZZZZ
MYIADPRLRGIAMLRAKRGSNLSIKFFFINYIINSIVKGI